MLVQNPLDSKVYFHRSTSNIIRLLVSLATTILSANNMHYAL